MKVLVDTSVWSGALRRKNGDGCDAAHELQNLILEHRVDIIGPIRQELLSGIKVEKQFRKLKKHLEAFPDIPLCTQDYETAAHFFTICRSKGIQGSNTDFLICAISVRCKMEIYTLDRDFTLFMKYIPIVLYQIKDGSKSVI